MWSAQPTMKQPGDAFTSEVRSAVMPRRRRVGGPRAAIETVARTARVQAHETALLLSAAATAPLRVVRSNCEPSSGVSPDAGTLSAPTPPVLLVHGFGGAKSSWSSVEQTLSARGFTVDTMNYAPLGSSVEQLADRLVAHAERTLARTGAQKLHLVGHSLGGVIVAQAVRDPRLRGRVDTVITLGSPFGGSPWAGVLPVVEMVRALRTGSPLLRRLAAAPLPDGVRWLSVTAALDVIVPGVRSVPRHPQVETVTFSGVGHLGMLVSRRVIGCIAAALCAAGPAAADELATGLLRSAS